VAENETECLDIIRQYLSYLPSHCTALPPVAPVPPESGAQMPRILELLPEKRNQDL
jgi:methylmalonyl-CoA decarboxylase subunit alpha